MTSDLFHVATINPGKQKREVKKHMLYARSYSLQDHKNVKILQIFNLIC